MSDQTDVPDGAAEAVPDGPWAIKLIAGRERQMAVDAAKRKKQTVGEWLAEAIRAHVDSERAESEGFDVFPPGSGEMVEHQVPTSPLSVSEIGQVVEIAERIAKLRGRSVPVGLLAAAQRALAMRMPPPPPKKQPPALPSNVIALPKRDDPH